MKLHRMSRVGKVRTPKRNEMDSLAIAMAKSRDERSRAISILLEAERYYHAMDRFRRDRERSKRYLYGDQWSDIICVNGRRMREDAYIMQQGNIPLKNNLLRRLVRNVIGVFRSQSSEPTCIARDRDEQKYGETMSTVLQYNMQLNHMSDLNARSLEEFLISGLVVHRKYFSWRNGKEECWTDYVQPNNFFIDNNMRDLRGWDCTFVGEIHDEDFKTLTEKFATSPSDYARLAEIYHTARNENALQVAWDDFGYSRDSRRLDFLMPDDSSRCRVIEVWRKESKPRYRCHDWNSGDVFKVDFEDYERLVVAENESRIRDGVACGMQMEEIPLIDSEWFMDSYWYYYFLSPRGDILREGETPYKHGEHPYVFKAYPFIDGEIHSFTSDVIDQQRYTNRLITLYDWIMRASAKGVLMIPEDCIPNGASPEEFAETWSRFNGVLMYKPSKSGAVPQQVASNSTNIGINELLNLQLKFFEDISGVHGALQGKSGYSGMSASLYSQQTQNATTSLLDLLDTFSEFIRDAAMKDVKNIQQYYSKEKFIEIAGAGSVIPDVDSARKILDMEFDLSIVPSTATPAYRAMANEFLMQIWSSGQITLQQLLETGQFPFADELLQRIKSQQEQLEQGQTPQGLPPQLLEQARQGSDVNAVESLRSAVVGS